MVRMLSRVCFDCHQTRFFIVLHACVAVAKASTSIRPSAKERQPSGAADEEIISVFGRIIADMMKDWPNDKVMATTTTTTTTFFCDDHRLYLQWKNAETQNSLGPWTATSFPGKSLSDAWGLGSIPGTGAGLRHALANRQCDRQQGFCPQPPSPNPACRSSVNVGVQVLPKDR
jgi:hypothetical protein